MTSLADKLQSKTEEHRSWQPPVLLDAKNEVARRALEELVDTQLSVKDPAEGIIDDLYEYEHPETHEDQAEKALFRAARLGVEFGTWVHFPWEDSVVRYPDQEDHFHLRTARNRFLDTQTEQEALYDRTVAFFGLSVGSNIVDQLAQSGIGNRYIIGDFDTLAPSNLNRLRASMEDVGANKIDIVAKKVSKTDPYITQTLERAGFTDNTSLLLDELTPNIIIDEVDDLRVKAQLRQYAKLTKTALVMVADIDDKSVLHVERHDQENIKPFKGAVSEQEFTALLDGSLPADQLQKLFIKTAGGIRHVSPRMIQSAGLIGKELGGLPQRGSTATAGATVVNIAARAIILERGMKTGTYVHDPRAELGIKKPTSRKDAFKILRDFAQTNK